MSKKLIAVASAAALALSAFVAIPAAAATPTVSLDGQAAGAGSSSSNATIRVPDENSIEVSQNAIEITVGELETGDVLRITTSGSVKAIDTPVDVENSAIFDVTSSHKSSIEKTRTTNSPYVFMVQSTSTTAGTVVVSVTRTGLTSTSTKYIKGVAGAAYKITDVTGVPTTMANGATASVTFKQTDIFGNAVESGTFTDNGDKSTNLGDVTFDSSAKVWKTTLTAPTSSAFTVTIDLGATDVDGFADATDSYVGVVNFAGNASLATQVASLISDYNALAKKWNKRVASNTAPKKKVALK
jgi:hypothetical protein